MGQGEPAERELRAVGAAADGEHTRLDAGGGEGLLRALDELGVRGDDLGHVAILPAHLHAHALRVELGVQERRCALHEADLRFEQPRVMVAHDVAGARALAGGGDPEQVDEALVALGVLGAHRGRQHGMEGAEQVRGVHHAVLRVAGMDGVALERDDDLAGVEALPFELANGPAVDGVGERAAERLQVEEGGAVADFLVRAEADAQPRVR